MPRSASPDATVASEAWFIPAPAPCARTRQAWAPCGCISRPETLRPELTSKLRGRGSFMVARSQPDGITDGTRDRRPLLIVDGDSFAHRAYHGLPTRAASLLRRAGSLQALLSERRFPTQPRISGCSDRSPRWTKLLLSRRFGTKNPPGRNGPARVR